VNTLVGIPRLCARFPDVDFVIGGDGPKRLVLEEMLEAHNLHARVGKPQQSRVDCVHLLLAPGIVAMRGAHFLSCFFVLGG